jgi:thiol-disulfide isomerase/thioredoxin
MYTLNGNKQLNARDAINNAGWKTWLKRHFLSLMMVAAALLLIFSKDVKAFALRGLLKTGIMGRPKIVMPAVVAGRSAADNQLAQTQFQDADGLIFSLHDLRGKVVFINLWATWCPPCRAEMPGIAALKAHFKNDSSVVFLMVDTDGTLKKSAAYLKRKELAVFLERKSLSPGENSLVKLLGTMPAGLYTKKIPATFVIDLNGKIVMHYEGAADYSQSAFIRSFRAFIDK